MNFVIVDVETTGGSPKSSKITELAMYKYDGNEIIDEYSSLINPEQDIPEFIVRLTGITNDHVKIDLNKDNMEESLIRNSKVNEAISKLENNRKKLIQR